MSLHGLIDILKGEPAATALKKMQQHITLQPEEGPCVFFFASLDNAKLILDAGHIYPRNGVEDTGTDLSSTGVQARRKKIWLGDGSKPRHPQKETHDCLNFYFNPTNPTFDAFCRNQLILGGLPPKVVVFEFALENIATWLEGKKALWACTQRNLARGGYTESQNSNLCSEWPWGKVFSVNTADHYEDPVSGEFLLWIKDETETCSAGLPINLARRALVAEGIAKELDGISCTTFTSFKPNHELLRTECHLQKFLQYQEIAELLVAMRSFEEAASSLPFGLSVERFNNQNIGRSYLHGIPHVTRVMFWCHVLTNEKISNRIHGGSLDLKAVKHDAMLAALIHDLCRESDKEDEKHGEASSTQFADTIIHTCQNDNARAQQVSDAVSYHCRPDSDYPCKDNPIYNILKDADALDRGRFSGPCNGTDFEGTDCGDRKCNHSGCAYKTLRLNYDEIYSQSVSWPFRKNLSMAAWNIASSTRTAPWNYQSPISFFTEWLIRGQHALLEIQEQDKQCSLIETDNPI